MGMNPKARKAKFSLHVGSGAGNFLKFWRMRQEGKVGKNGRKKGWTQLQAAKALGIKQSTYARYENGSRHLPDEIYQKLRAEIRENEAPSAEKIDAILNRK
jgi:DNA-binding XRE family transcriptional regulator